MIQKDVFNNTYTADSVQATVEVITKSVGQNLEANEFELALGMKD